MLKRFMGVRESEPEPAAPAKYEVLTAAEEAAGVNVKTAIDAHIKWKHRLESYVEGSSTEKLQPAVVSADHHCVLGKWIHGDGKEKFDHVDIFKELVDVHAQFHRHAGEVMNIALQGEQEKARQMLQTGGYPRTSAKVKKLLAKLYVDVLCDHGTQPPAGAAG